jgi:3-hydroxymyristoyl/3-hydroxydecanoyl-(acyl carrier protein) dehydratase
MSPDTPIESRVEIATDHPAFAGHFPGRPMLPGVAILAEALAAVEAATGTPCDAWEVESVKFTSAVGPGACLTIKHRVQDGRARFEVLEGARRVASGVLASGTPPGKP